MVTIEELDKKGKKVKKTVVYEGDSDDDDDEDMIDLEFMERMLQHAGDEDDDDESILNYDMDDSDEDIDSDDYDENEFIDDVNTDDDSSHNQDDNDEDESIDEDLDYEEDDDSNIVDDGEENKGDRKAYESNNKERNLQALYTKDGEELWTLDLRNLVAINAHQMDYAKLLRTSNTNMGRKETEENSNINTDHEKMTINAEHVMVNEDYLLEKASDGCLQLLTGLWGLDTQKSDAGPMAILPSYFEIPTPRSLPPPPPKIETKWEKFAKERRISPKEKRSRKVWDESTQSWAHLTGSGKASSEKEWPIMEVKKGDDPFEDPWQKSRDAKKNRVEKNIENRMRNQERTGNLVKGTTMRTVKALKKARENGREGGSNDKIRPAGVPIDLSKGQKRGKELTKAALLATQRSTASLGKFDEMREGEPDRKKSKEVKKRKFEGATDRVVVNNEVSKNMKVLEKVITGGKEKDRDIRKGKFAKGETGHDYDFDDGLGPSSFKKKKGRAGAGKIRKITKKRIT